MGCRATHDEYYTSTQLFAYISTVTANERHNSLHVVKATIIVNFLLI